MIETEKKYRLTSEIREKVLRNLAEMGADDDGSEFEENIIYGGGVLDAKLAVLRIRSTPGKILLTYKQSVVSDSQYKERVEYETEFKDLTALKEILYNLGFRPRLVYEKRRHTWKLRSVEVVLDELPFGEFMEIEGSITGIAEAEMLLDIEGIEPEPETYPALASRHGNLINGIRESRFPGETDSAAN